MGIVHQVLLMRQLCRPFIEAEIVAAGRFQALMAENFFDMTHRAAIEEKLLGCRVPCGRTGLFNPASLRVPGERPPDFAPVQTRDPVLRNE